MSSWQKDVYFQKEYGLVNETVELGEAVLYELNSPYGKISSVFIKRRIPLDEVEGNWYDIRTPYGYGGPLIIESTDKESLIADYYDDFSSFCKKNNIITEFVRFHPIAQNALDFKTVYDIILDRHTVGTNMLISNNPIESEFSKSCRKNIKRALNKGLSYKIVEKPKELNCFKSIYYETMDRNDATDFYYFGDKYFDDLLEYFKENILAVYVYYGNQIVAAGIYFVTNSIIHIHLSGTLSQYLKFNPPYVLRYAIAEWALTHGIRYLHHGGGRTSSSDDSLFQFKKQFGMNTLFDYYIGEKVWNSDMYKIVCQQKKPEERVNDFIRRKQ